MLTHPLFRVAVLCSRRAPGLMHLLTRVDGRDRDWRIVCCLCSEGTFAEEEAVAPLIPVIHHPVRRFYDEFAPDARLVNLVVREKYDHRTLQLLQPYQPNLIVLAGYLLLLTPPVLSAFPDRIINVHHADLSRRTLAGAPRYPGLRAVRDAILAGERETRSSAHLVNAHLDAGPPLLRSRPYPVPEVAAWAIANGADDVLRKVIWQQQEWMLRTAFGPLIEHAIEILAEREMAATIKECA